MYKFTNRLIKETSPYLLQHAHNPVDWYPWGEEAFEKAREENKPVFLSIGYSSCHWCHVMEHESFENEEIAAIMNEHFISIKVDREERPDIDQLYMQYVQMTTGSGGWPMSVFLTAEQKPFYGGTYFPPDDRYGRPGFKRVLETMAEFYRKDKENLAKILLQVDDAFSGGNELQGSEEMPDRADWDSALEQLTKMYEPVFGGIGRAPKFPAVNVLNLFLREFSRTKEINYLNMVTHTLKNMANGGIYDQIGGGFARYSVDEKWLVPHFEKMLYDNGQLAVLYLDTYLVTGEKFFLKVAEETLAFVLRELTSPEGGFYSSLDADSEGEEGRFYIWSKEEIENILGKNDADIFNNYYGVTLFGNFEGRNILFVNKSMEQLASETGRPVGILTETINACRAKLLNEREKRTRPALDDKVITSWDGLMLSAFARAYQVTQRPEYLSVVNKNIRFLKKNLYGDNILKRTYKNGQAKYDGFIEDYAILINALLDSYEAVFDPELISCANDLTSFANEHFRDKVNGGYYTASDQQEKLFKRMKDTSDSSIPSGSGIMLMNNLRLFSLTENARFYEIAGEILKTYKSGLTANPYGFSSYLAALDFYLEKPLEILIARTENQKISDYLNLVFGTFRPNKVVIVLSEKEDFSSLTASLVNGKKTIDGKTTAYVCRNFTCSLPVHSLNDLEKLLNN